MTDGGRPPSSQSNGLWHPWLRINRLILQIRTATWDVDVWPAAKVVFKPALIERRKLTREGWWN